jgi:2-methylisocitrate lyase-like PEP mutase family enzyme
VPVTADVEAGYGDRPEDAALTCEGVIKAGAVGLNLEDGVSGVPRRLADLSLQLEKILAVREMAERLGVPLVVNARTDVYLAQVGEPETRYGETVRRLAAFRDAGADCLFAPGVRDLEVIRQLVRELKHPINILAGPGSPSVPELQKLGVARVSLGSSVMRATLGVLGRIAQELREAGTYHTLQDAPSHTELNRLMAQQG